MNPPRPSRSVLGLLTVLLGYFVLPMAMTGTSVALPEIGRDLDASGASLQWVVTGYVLAASSVMLVAGSLGDLFGRRKVYAIGIALYAAGTLAAAAGQSILVLDVARTVAGVGAAAVMAGGVAILAGMYDETARPRVFATVGTTAGVGIALGPTLSGALVGAFGWRSSFLLFGAAGVLILLLTRLIPESRAAERPTVDRPGVVTFIAGLALLMFALTQGSRAGWVSLAVLGPLGAGAALLAAFVAVERRAANPVLDLSLIRDRRFSGWLVAAMAVTLGSTGVLVFLPTYLQGTGGLTAAGAGTLMLLMTVPVFALPSFSGLLVARGLPPRRLATAALLLSAAGNLWLALVLAPDAGAGALAPPLLLIGAGNGLGLGQFDAQALGSVSAERMGMASGLLSTGRSVVGTLVLAGFGAALMTLVESGLGDRAAADRVVTGRGAEIAGEFTGAWQTLVGAIAAALVLAAVLVRWMLRPGAAPAAPGPGEPAPAERRTSKDRTSKDRVSEERVAKDQAPERRASKERAPEHRTSAEAPAG
ncbi:MFS transporter [Streptomyces sp. NPDC020141]|uniref:MFS transporter n=1 Tax=Streptomyces sp. NPDC020141 TaxID=3365065 RepID=UPI0037A23445